VSDVQATQHTTSSPEALGKASVLIAGAGIGGLCAAIAFARAGVPVQVFEQQPLPVTVGAGIQLSPNATRVLASLELLDPIARVATRPQALETRSYRSGRVIARHELNAEWTRTMGAPYLHVYRPDLMRVLIEQVAGCPNIHLAWGTRVDAFREDDGGVSVITEKGEFTGAVLIGADGIHSRVASGLFPDVSPTYTGQTAYRALVRADQLPPGHYPVQATVYWGPGRHIVSYFVGDYMNLVCVVEGEAPGKESWVEPASKAAMLAHFKAWHEPLVRLLERADPETIYKWSLYDRPPLPAWSRSRVTLLGDACHAMLPFLAQGAAMAIEDAGVLSALVTPMLANRKVDGVALRSALQDYDQLRLARTHWVQAGARRNATVFHLKGIAAWLRNRAAAKAGHRTLDRLYRFDVETNLRNFLAQKK
jgi:salicylate hydroxylase